MVQYLLYIGTIGPIYKRYWSDETKELLESTCGSTTRTARRFKEEVGGLNTILVIIVDDQRHPQHQSEGLHLCDLHYHQFCVPPISSQLPTSTSPLVRHKGRRSHCLSEINVLFGAEVFGDGDAVEVLADLTVMDGGDVEEQDEADEDEHGGD